MELKEARRIVREMASNRALLVLGDAVDAIESKLAEAAAVEKGLESMKAVTEEARIQRDKITQEVADLKAQKVVAKFGLDIQYKNDSIEYDNKMSKLEEEHRQKRVVIVAKTDSLRGAFVTLEHATIEQQKRLDNIRAQLEGINRLLDQK